MGLNDRKRKSMNTIQNNDKKRKNVTLKKSSSSEESDEQSDQDNGLNHEVKNDIPAISRWPQDDVQKLLAKMELILPKNDSTSFRSRLSKIDWEKIKFGKYHKDECQSTWLAIQDQLRTFKTLGDLVNDAKYMLATKGIDTYQSKQNRLHRPKSAYMIYYMDILQKTKKKHPDLKMTELTQVIAEKYKNLSPEKKQYYIDQAQKLRTEYNEMVDKTKFIPTATVTEESIKPSNKSTSKSSSKPLSKPKTPFQIFLEAKSTDLDSNVDKTEFQNHLKEKWDNMSEKKKSKYIKLANEREQTYLNNLKEDHKNDPAFTLPTKSALTKGDRNILDSQSGKPKKPPVNSYGLYSKEMLQSNALDGVPPKERMTMLAQKWKAFSNEERQIYADRLKVIVERYKTEYDAFLKTLPENERQIEIAKTKVKPKKAEPKVVPRINAREGIIEKPKKKTDSKYNPKTKMFENEPKGVPFKNAFELYRSKIEPNEKHQITSLEEWNSKAGRKQVKYENELKALKKEYMKDLKVFLKSLSEDDLKLYLKLRKPELVTEKTDKESSASENEDSSSEEDNDNENDNNDSEDDDDDDDDDDDSDSE
ncbi:nucleolar transcription factor 1-B-like [Sipha flava]|jgi:hypothetical protein|uniref:Nucleolar transcription factor 1 n=1 Tax=Sipha flava TaxID=143950 RepID=A0A2S2QEJ1_9HEMI|nr:nucleolar transcription factor 1-B-like [Sipha flava]